MTSPLASISPLARRIQLARDIDRLRRQAGYTQVSLAKAIGQSRQAVSRIENPLTNMERSIVADHVRDILLTCGLPSNDPEHQRIMDVMWSARREGWWMRGHEQMGERQQLIADVELGTSLIREYQPYLPPGLVQTEAFARCRAGIFAVEAAELDALVRGRLERQRVTLSRDDLTYQLVLEEMAIRRRTAPPQVLREQLHHLLQLAERPNISVRVLTLEAPLSPGQVPTTPCSIYTYPEPADPEIAVIDTVLRDHVVSDPDEVRVYAQLFDRLRAAALSDADSAAFIRKAADAVTDEEPVA